jgi:Secreted repeat of unknown function
MKRKLTLLRTVRGVLAAAAHAWQARGSPGAKQSQLGTTRRANGSRQVTYAGHPLYRYVQDRKPGHTTGEGLLLFGAYWDAVSPRERRSSPMAARDGRSPVMSKLASASTRELARRLSGSDEVLLLWRPENDRVELSVRERTTGEGFHIEVAPRAAMDAFRHPYAYAARRESASSVACYSSGAGD